MNFSDYLELEQFSMPAQDRRPKFMHFVNELHQLHLNNSSEYRIVSEKYFNVNGQINDLEALPFLPVSIFKEKELSSIPQKDVYKVLTSSGTTSQIPSKIILDKETAALQTKSLAQIIKHIIGSKRLPMMIIDSKSIIKNKKSFSARGAGILGLSVFGKNHLYSLDENFNTKKEELIEFVGRHRNGPILIFGFTFLVWQYLKELDFDLDLSNAFLIHSGGWKKLQDMAVDNLTFKKELNKKHGIKPENIYNFYGMVEQVGSVFLENSDGFLHCPNFQEILIRDPETFEILPHGKEGLIQVISLLPKSYPGHSLLTEDIGVIMGEDNASNQWKGKYFRVLGRVKKSEPRGCSDTFERT